MEIDRILKVKLRRLESDLNPIFENKLTPIQKARTQELISFTLDVFFESFNDLLKGKDLVELEDEDFDFEDLDEDELDLVRDYEG